MREAFHDFSELADPKHARIDELRVGVGSLWRLREHFPVQVDDVLDVGMAVYATDRLVRRVKARGSWEPRDLSLRVPVAHPEVWETLRAPLIELLEWLTTDRWTLDFVAADGRRRNRPASVVPPRLPERPFVGLYSGGLDSLAGVIAQAQDPAFDAAVLVGGQAAPRLKGLQTKQRAELAARLPHLHWEAFRGFRHPYKPGQLGKWQVAEQKQEKSQRSRAFLFLVFGAVTAYAYRTDTLHVYENGPGAINLPYTPAFGGADLTRAMHPKTLVLAARFFTALFGEPFQVVNPSLWLTKGEMCGRVAGWGLGDLVTVTKSCDSFPLREARDQCGLCTSCLLRRISLHAAGLRFADQEPAQYRDDIYAMNTGTSDRHLRPYFYMLEQARTLDRVTGTGQLLDFRLEFDALDEARYALEELTGLPTAEVDARLVRLYRRHAQEVLEFHDELTAIGQEGMSDGESRELQRTQ